MVVLMAALMEDLMVGMEGSTVDWMHEPTGVLTVGMVDSTLGTADLTVAQTVEPMAVLIRALRPIGSTAARVTACAMCAPAWPVRLEATATGTAGTGIVTAA